MNPYFSASGRRRRRRRPSVKKNTRKSYNKTKRGGTNPFGLFDPLDDYTIYIDDVFNPYVDLLSYTPMDPFTYASFNMLSVTCTKKILEDVMINNKSCGKMNNAIANLRRIKDKLDKLDVVCVDYDALYTKIEAILETNITENANAALAKEQAAAAAAAAATPAAPAAAVQTIEHHKDILCQDLIKQCLDLIEKTEKEAKDRCSNITKSIIDTYIGMYSLMPASFMMALANSFSTQMLPFQVFGAKRNVKKPVIKK